MPTFILDVEPYSDDRVRLRLSNGDGTLLCTHEVAIADPRHGWEPVFATRLYLERRKREGATHDDAFAEVNRFVADKLLGSEFVTHLAQGIEPRTLLVRLPPVTPRAADTIRN